MAELSIDAQTLLAALRQQLGPTFSLEALRQFIETKRNKSLIIEEVEMKASRSGFAAHLKDCDLAYIAQGLATEQRLNTTLHEFVHIVRGDGTPLNFISYDEFTAHQDQFMQNGVFRDKEQTQVRIEEEVSVGEEDDAEVLARVLMRSVFPIEHHTYQQAQLLSL